MHYCKGHLVYFYQIYYVQVSIYPLRIYLTEAMYRKLWEYLFPGDEQDVKRQVYLVETLHCLECTIRVYRCWCLNLHFIQCVHWSVLLVPSKYCQVSSVLPWTRREEIFCISVMLISGPNYRRFGKFQPLSLPSEEAVGAIPQLTGAAWSHHIMVPVRVYLALVFPLHRMHFRVLSLMHNPV